MLRSNYVIMFVSQSKEVNVYGRKKSQEQRRKIAELDRKIAFHKEKIASLEAKKSNLLAPKLSAREIISAAKKKGMTTEDIMKKLGID